MGKEVILPVQVGGPRVCSEGVKVSLERGSPGLAIWARIGKGSAGVGVGGWGGGGVLPG